MKKQLKKDIKKRLKVYKLEKKKLLLKFIIYSTFFSQKIRQNAFDKLHKLNNTAYSYKTQVKNRCIFTLRGRGVLGSFKLSRITFRKLASEGNLVGIKKSS